MILRLLLSTAASAAAFSADVETRRSTLRAFGNSGTELGWTLERRRSGGGGVIEVFVGISRRSGNAEEGSEDLMGGHAVAVTLPDYLDDDAGGGVSASLWNSALAGSILLRSDSWRAALAEKDVLELGSGLGLAGLVASTTPARRVVLTDKVEDAVAALKDTVARNSIDGLCELEARQLDWKDEHTDEAKADIVIGTDLAYYYHLIRPLMDTSRACMRPDNGILFIVGQANRESQWGLFHNLVDGSYNVRTDEKEPSWPGETRMLLYNLSVGPWSRDGGDVDDNGSSPQHEEIPIAALLHTTQSDRLASLLTPNDHVATKVDEESQMMSF